MSRGGGPARWQRGLAQLALFSAPVWLVALRDALPQMLGLAQAAPDPLLLGLAVAAWAHSPALAVLMALVSGCLVDAAAGPRFGLEAVRMGALVALCGSLRGALALEVPGARLLLVGLFVLADRALAVLSLALWLPHVPWEALLLRAGWIALATAPLAPLGFAVGQTLADALGRGGRR